MQAFFCILLLTFLSIYGSLYAKLIIMRKYKILLPSFWVTIGAFGIAAVAAVFNFSFKNFLFVSATSFLMLMLGAYIEKIDERKKPDWADVKHKFFIPSFAVGMLCSALGYFPKTFIGICILLYVGGIFDIYAQKQRNKHRSKFVLVGAAFGIALIMFWLATYKH